MSEQGAPFLSPLREKWGSVRRKSLPLVLPFLKHVLDRRLVNHQIRVAILTVHLDAIPVIPFDDPAHFFPIAQNDHHRRSRLHLLLIIKVLRVGLLRGCGLLASPASHRSLAAIPAIHSLHAFSTVVPLRPLASFLRHRSRIVAIVILHAWQRGPNQLAV